MCDLALEYIRTHYGVPAHRGARIRYTGGPTMEGTILSGRGPHLRVQFDGRKYKSTVHPTWEIEYLTQGK